VALLFCQRPKHWPGQANCGFSALARPGVLGTGAEWEHDSITVRERGVRGYLLPAAFHPHSLQGYVIEIKNKPILTGRAYHESGLPR
jgi:hypothetical protein